MSRQYSCSDRTTISHAPAMTSSIVSTPGMTATPDTAEQKRDLPTISLAPPRSGPFKFFGLVGALSLAIAGQAWLRWLFSDNFRASPKGSDPFTGWRVHGLHGVQIVVMSVATFVVWRFLLRPLIRERRLTTDGLIILGSATMWWMDPMWYNYFNISFIYNTHLINFGSWVAYIPG